MLLTIRSNTNCSSRYLLSSSLSDQGRARVDSALCSSRASKSFQHNVRGPDTRPTVCKDRGNRSSEKTRTWSLWQLKEQPGFLVCLPLHPEWGAIFNDSRCTQKKRYLLSISTKLTILKITFYVSFITSSRYQTAVTTIHKSHRV